MSANHELPTKKNLEIFFATVARPADFTFLSKMAMVLYEMRPGLPLRSMLNHLITLCTLGTANFDLPHSSGCFGYSAEILVANFLLLCVEGIDPAIAAGVHKDPFVNLGNVL